MKKIITIAKFAMASAFLMYGMSAFSQEEGPPGNIAEEWAFLADPAAIDSFEDAFKEHMALRKENNDPFHWDVFTSNTGDDLTAYYVRACCFAWGERDAYEGWYNEHPKVVEHWYANVYPHLKGHRHDFEEIDFENSHWPDDAPTPMFVGVTSYEIKPGQWQPVNAAKAEISQALLDGWATDGRIWAWVSSISGAPRMHLVVPFENYADMAQPDPTVYQFLSEKLGAEKSGALFQQFSGGTKGSTYEIYSHRPDLSTQN